MLFQAMEVSDLGETHSTQRVVKRIGRSRLVNNAELWHVCAIINIAVRLAIIESLVEFSSSSLPSHKPHYMAAASVTTDYVKNKGILHSRN
jgi:hypothetical protein